MYCKFFERLKNWLSPYKENTRYGGTYITRVPSYKHLINFEGIILDPFELLEALK